MRQERAFEPAARLRPGHAILFLALSALLLSWPALVNRSSIFFPDTVNYVRSGEVAWKTVGKAVGLAAPTPVIAAPTAADVDTKNQATIDQKAPLAGRSIYYGVFAQAIRAVAGFTAIAVAQALLIGLVLLLALRRLGVTGWGGRLLVMGGVALGTTLPFFAGVAMPDVFAALTIVPVALLIAYRDRMAAGEQAFWLLAIVVACMFHMSFAVAGFATLVLAAGLAWGRLRRTVGSFALLAGALFLGAALLSAANVAVERFTKQAFMPIPFLLARTIGDGTAAPVLRERCRHEKLATCYWLPAMPLHSNDFLWDLKHPTVKPWIGMTDPEKRQVAAEQRTIVLAAVAAHPVEQVVAAFRNSAEQLTTVDLMEFRNQPNFTWIFSKTLSEEFRAYEQSPLWRGTFSLPLLSRLSLVVYLAALVGSLLLLLLWRRLPIATDDRLRLACSIMLAGLLANAAVHGALSAVFGRYQGRVSWIALFVLLVLLVRMGLERRRLA